MSAFNRYRTYLISYPFSENVALFDYIKEEVGFRLSDRVFDIKKKFDVAVDLGCGRGHVSKHILAETVDHLILCDMSPGQLSQAETTPGVKVTRKEMDEEEFDFEENSLDLVISSLNLHWVNDLPGCFQRIMRSLKPDGCFMASLFGGETLYELRSSLQLAEMERRGGLAPHISPFTQVRPLILRHFNILTFSHFFHEIQIRDIGSLLNRAGFTMLTIDTDEIGIGYPTMFELMDDLQGMAENNAAFNRPLHLSRETQMAAAAIYQNMYGKPEGIPATFQVIYFVAWKPGPNQPQPLERGTGDVSFKDLGKVIESTKNGGKL